MWEDLKPASIVSPVNLIKEIANELNRVTKEAIVFFVEHNVYRDYSDITSLLEDSSDDNSKRVIRLKLSVPALNAYTLNLIRVVYDVRTVYPCEVADIIGENNVSAESSKVLGDRVREILNSKKVKDIVSNLWAQVRD